MINNEDLLALQSYVTAHDSTQYADLHADTLVLDVTHSNLKQKHIEIRFDKHTTIGSLRDKDNDRMLGYYSLSHGATVHCIDLDPHSGSKGGGYEDTSLVKKYVMSDEDYDKRKGTLRDWGKQQKEKDSTFTLAKHAKQHRELMDAQRQAKLGLELPSGFEYDNNGKVVRIEPTVEEPVGIENKENNNNSEFGKETVEGIEVGMRCEVSPGSRRGSVAFVGEVPELGNGGFWIGVIFDEPVGKTDGTAKSGKRYFDAPGTKYGGFVRGKNVEVGEFPERDIMDELEDSDDEL